MAVKDSTNSLPVSDQIKQTHAVHSRTCLPVAMLMAVVWRALAASSSPTSNLASGTEVTTVGGLDAFGQGRRGARPDDHSLHTFHAGLESSREGRTCPYTALHRQDGQGGGGDGGERRGVDDDHFGLMVVTKESY